MSNQNNCHPKGSRMVVIFRKFTSWERKHLIRRTKLHWTRFGADARQSKSKPERNSMGKDLDMSSVYRCCLDWVFRLYNWFCYNGYDASVLEICSVLASEDFFHLLPEFKFSQEIGIWSVLRWVTEFPSNFVKLHTCRYCFNWHWLLYSESEQTEYHVDT